MAPPSKKRIAAAVLDRYGRTFAEEAGIKVRKNSPSDLYKLMCMSLLFSARISGEIAMKATKALFDQGWTTAAKLADSTWEKRAKVLNKSGYARYDERTSTMLGESAGLLLDRWDGDLRKLREEAGNDPAEERKLLKRFKGIGDAGADIFFREVQVAWKEVAPFADGRALRAAERLGLGKDVKALGRHAKGDELARLVASLVRVDLDNTHDELLEAAGS